MSTTLEQAPAKSLAATSGKDTAALRPRALKRMQEREKRRTSKFDVVSAFLLALLWFVGVFVLLLSLIWVTHRIAVGPGPLRPIPETAGRGASVEGVEHDFEPPGTDEIVDLAEPAIQETLTAVTDAVSTVAASLDALTSDAAATAEGDALGDHRPPGPESDGENIIPPHERWELRFSAKSVNNYAQQLDFYKIEFGVVGGGVHGVEYASNLSGSPQTRRSESAGEKRLYFMWADRSSPLIQYDRQLLQKAGMHLGPGREMLKFIEPELERILAGIELQYAADRGHSSASGIEKTVFESQPQGSGYRFAVIDQRYRTAKR